MQNLEKLQDMLVAMQVLRDNNANALVMAHAEIAALKRKVAELESAIKPPAKPVTDNLPSNPYAEAA